MSVEGLYFYLEKITKEIWLPYCYHLILGKPIKLGNTFLTKTTLKTQQKCLGALFQV